MPQLQPVYFWEAKVIIKCQNLAFSLEANDEGRGISKKRIFSASWNKNGKVCIDPSKRIGGWIKQQLSLLRSSYAQQVNAIKVFPIDNERYVEVCKLSELTGGDIPIPDASCEFIGGLPKQPFWQRIQVQKELGGGTRNTTTYWYEYNKPVELSVKIISFARGLTPDIVKEAFEKLGLAIGIGDKHSQGYGRFELVSFDAKQEKLSL